MKFRVAYRILSLFLALISFNAPPLFALPSAGMNTHSVAPALIIPAKKHSNVKPVPNSVRVCRRGNGMHYNLTGQQVYGPWVICRKVPARCAVGHGWYFDPEGQQHYGNFRTCNFNSRGV